MLISKNLPPKQLAFVRILGQDVYLYHLSRKKIVVRVKSHLDFDEVLQKVLYLGAEKIYPNEEQRKITFFNDNE